MPRAPLLALLTDFGEADGYVGVMKGVALGIAPGLPLVDLTHAIPPQDVAAAAWVLHTSWRSFPVGTLFLCVVDPGVGTARRAVALLIEGNCFVGPDNGLFSYVLETATPEGAVVLDQPRFHRPQPSATFHGRDIFAPCAAHLAAGVPLVDIGSALDPAALVRLPPLAPTWETAKDTPSSPILRARIAHIDHFGNLITSIGAALASEILATPAARVRLGGKEIAARAPTFAEGPAEAPCLVRDSSGYLAIAVRNGSAAALLGAARGDPVLVAGLRPR
jgi:S-adenosylmethionine hydrolase